MFVIFFNLGMAFLMLILGIVFIYSQGKAARFLTGYQPRSKEERRGLDEEQLCQIYGKWFLAMAIPFIIGTLVAFFKDSLGLIVGWGGWVILFILLLWTRRQLER